MGRQIEVSNRDIHLQHRAFLQAALSTRLVRVDGAPAFIYTSISSPDHIVVTVTEVTGEFGGLLVPDGEIELGSWFRRFRIKRSTGEKISEIAAKAGRAAELQYIDSPRSQNDEREANAVSNLI